MDAYMEGKITLNGKTTTFSVNEEGMWQNWGADKETLGTRVDLLDKIKDAFIEFMQEEG